MASREEFSTIQFPMKPINIIDFFICLRFCQFLHRPTRNHYLQNLLRSFPPFLRCLTFLSFFLALSINQNLLKNKNSNWILKKFGLNEVMKQSKSLLRSKRFYPTIFSGNFCEISTYFFECFECIFYQNLNWRLQNLYELMKNVSTKIVEKFQLLSENLLAPK